jgi:putative ABC transport system permease protein
MTLGAHRGDILKLVIGQGMKPVLIGLSAGLLGALALTRAMTGLLFGVSPNDPTTFGAVAIVLLIAPLLACYIPARRAMKVDAVTALRDT